MSSEEIKVGEQVMASDFPIEHSDWLGDQGYSYTGKLKDGRHAVEFTDNDGDSVVLPWKFVRAKPTVVPYTAETFPKGVVWVRGGNWCSGIRVLVDKVSNQGVLAVDHNWDYRDLLEDCEISTDGGHTWHKAGVES